MTKHQIYIAGPYTAPTLEGIAQNVHKAALVACLLMRRGHHIHCPHTHSHLIDMMSRQAKLEFTHEEWMDLDLELIRTWASAVFFIGPSRGADMEKALAEAIGLPVFTSINDVPNLTGVRDVQEAGTAQVEGEPFEAALPAGFLPPATPRPA